MCRGVEWKRSDNLRLVSLFEQGKSPKQIAALMNRSVNSIYVKCRHIGLSFRERGKLDRHVALIKRKNVELTARQCLRCKVSFDSTGIGNRICPGCTKLNAGYVGVVYG